MEILKYLGYVHEEYIMKIFLNASILILPYNTPGGHSGVLEQAIFFQIPVVVVDFPEYREQIKEVDFAKLFYSAENLENLCREILKYNTIREIKINVREKVEVTINNVKNVVSFNEKS